MNERTRHPLSGFMDMYYTMEPEKARHWMKRINQLPRHERNHVLSEFERVKEGYYDGTEVLRCSDPLCGMLTDLLDDYWTARDDYHGGYYWQYMPEPIGFMSQARYFEHVGLSALILNEQFVMMSQGVEPVDLFYLMALRCQRERDRVYHMVEHFDSEYAILLRSRWPQVCDLLMECHVANENRMPMSGVEDARHLMDNFVMTLPRCALGHLPFTIYNVQFENSKL